MLRVHAHAHATAVGQVNARLQELSPAGMLPPVSTIISVSSTLRQILRLHMILHPICSDPQGFLACCTLCGTRLVYYCHNYIYCILLFAICIFVGFIPIPCFMYHIYHVLLITVSCCLLKAYYCIIFLFDVYIYWILLLLYALYICNLLHVVGYMFICLL